MACGVFNDDKMKLIPNPACLQYFKSKAPDENMRTNLFVYQHMESKNFMLGSWVGGDIFMPILELGKEPLLNDDVVAAYTRYCHPESAQDLTEGLREAKSNQRRLDEDFQYNNRTERARQVRDELGIRVRDEDGCAFLPPGMFA